MTDRTSRSQLGETVEELAARMDVKGRAQARAADLRDKAGAMTVQLRSTAAQAGHAAHERAAHAGHKIHDGAAGTVAVRHPRPALVVGAVVAVAAVVAWRYAKR
ncbi:hypothetical protein GCM10022403_028400 [Streptomyces coacervatus]|uniref:DUF3618 domain-containing protein n=1 Tax=Streptomyces coacervatus TaxID=647381 RepID=A0ABP7HN24_9ACTN|nr:DUF3618 domain-containing protein [Streptomyces coacervatus]MDF2265426.1 DUF3618 domain-containing protein [Streptomyces coacervatus]